MRRKAGEAQGDRRSINNTSFGQMRRKHCPNAGAKFSDKHSIRYPTIISRATEKYVPLWGPFLLAPAVDLV